MDVVSQSSLTDEVEHQLYQHIKDANLSPGDALPGEIELSAQLGVSRAIVREALSRLRLLGVIDSRKRRGLRLATPDPLAGFDRVLDAGLLTPHQRSELAQMRIVLEVGIADLLFDRIKLEDFVHLEAIVQQEDNERFDPEQRRRWDRSFHARLHSIAGNTLLARLQDSLEARFEHPLAGTGARRRGEVTHADLLDILRNGSPTHYRRAIRLHFGQAQDRLRVS